MCIHICKMNSNLLLDSYPNGIAKALFAQAYAAVDSLSRGSGFEYSHRTLDGCLDFAPDMTRLTLNRRQRHLN